MIILTTLSLISSMETKMKQRIIRTNDLLGKVSIYAHFDHIIAHGEKDKKEPTDEKGHHFRYFIAHPFV